MNNVLSDPVPTGISVLDEMLAGGLPRNRAVLVTGGPGAGKSTLGMQFLQAGLASGEKCLYISTEQTTDELRGAFRDFEFDLDHENLQYTTIHARRGQTLDADEGYLLETAEENNWFDRGFETPFTSEYIQSHLKQFGPCDRVVFDSTSGLAVISESIEQYRRLMFDLIRFFTDELAATTVFTAEDYPGDTRGDVLRFTAHGVIELDTELLGDDAHRYLSVPKMRGVDHDRRRVELRIHNGRLTVSPQRRSDSTALADQRLYPTGIDGLDELTGGGLIRGAGTLLTHDSRASLTALVGQLIQTAVEREFALVLVPTLTLRERHVKSMVESYGLSLSTLFDRDQLFVLDQVGGWETDSDNVFRRAATVAEAIQHYEVIDQRCSGDWLTIENASAMVHTLGVEDTRSLRYSEELAFLTESELLVHLLNPSVVDEQIAAFYRDSARQVPHTRHDDGGIQYLTLEKSPAGYVGSTVLVEHIDTEPYIRIQTPPGS